MWENLSIALTFPLYLMLPVVIIVQMSLVYGKVAHSCNRFGDFDGNDMTLFYYKLVPNHAKVISRNRVSVHALSML